MARETHKAQHFVPECYLKAWCDPACPPDYEPYVWLFDRDGGAGKRRAPSNIFKETDMYTITKADGNRDLRLEHGLSGLESVFAGLRKNKLDRKLPLDDDEHTSLAAFVAAGQFRTARSRDHHAKQWGRAAEIADDLQARLDEATPEQRRAMASTPSLSSGGPSLTHEQVKQLASTPIQLMISQVLRTVIPVLKRMKFAIMCSDDPVGFITSDAPVSWFDPEAYKLPPLYRSPGLASRTIEVTMPLSPRQCAVFSWHDFEGYIDVPRYVVDEYNRRHRVLCDKQYVVCSDVRYDAWFVEREMPEDAWENRQESDDDSTQR